MAAKNDLERIGLFKEQGYTTIGDPYAPPNNKPFNPAAGKGAQMMIGGSKSRSGLQAGYFDDKFNRILEGEAYTDIVKIRRKERLDQSKKNIGKTWTPSNITKKPSGVGSYYGCFTTNVGAFSATQKASEKYRSPGKNFLAAPGKRGTGYGYLGVTIGEYQKYTSDPYDRGSQLRKRESNDDIKKRKGGPFKLCSSSANYFDDNPYHSKKGLPPEKESAHVGGTKGTKPKPFQPSSPAKAIGGCKAGTFTGYPEHSKEPFIVSKTGSKESSKKFIGGVFRPSQCPKSMPTHSVVAQQVVKTMNRSNCT